MSHIYDWENMSIKEQVGDACWETWPTDARITIERLERKLAVLKGQQRAFDLLIETAQRLTQVSPTVIPQSSEECKFCFKGFVNIGTIIDPESGPCPMCSCEWHQESHRSCIWILEKVLKELEN